ncbi:MAG: DMT family transporter [Candidatus Thermoplasmatota archaeon]
MYIKDKILNYLLLTLASLAFAGSFVAVRVTVDELNPVHLGFLRFAVATPLMILVLFLTKKNIKLPSKKEIMPLSLLGLTGVTFLYILQFTGVKLTNASTSGVLINTNVIFIAVLSALFLKETFSLKKTTGILLSFTGVIVVVLGQMSGQKMVLDYSFLLGCILIISSAVCWAVFSVAGKHMLKRFDSISLTTYAFILGTFLFLPFVMPDIISVVPHISIEAWIAVLYLGIFCSIFAYLAWYYALSKTEAGKSAVFLNFIPVFTIILSFFLVDETPTFLFLLGAALVIIGVYVTQKH